MTVFNQDIADLKEVAQTLKAAERASNTFRKELYAKVANLSKKGYDAEILKSESGLPMSIVQKIIGN